MYSRFGLLGLVLHSWGLDLGYCYGFGYGYGMDTVTAPALEWRLSFFFFFFFVCSGCFIAFTWDWRVSLFLFVWFDFGSDFVVSDFHWGLFPFAFQLQILEYSLGILSCDLDFINAFSIRVMIFLWYGVDVSCSLLGDFCKIGDSGVFWITLKGCDINLFKWMD